MWLLFRPPLASGVNRELGGLQASKKKTGRALQGRPAGQNRQICCELAHRSGGSGFGGLLGATRVSGCAGGGVVVVEETGVMVAAKSELRYFGALT